MPVGPTEPIPIFIVRAAMMQTAARIPTFPWEELHGCAFEGSRVLITGGAGFIGSHLAEALVALGGAVCVVDDLSGGDRLNLESFGPVEFVKGSILDTDLLTRCTAGCRYVFHLAALGSVPRSVREP